MDMKLLQTRKISKGRHIRGPKVHNAVCEEEKSAVDQLKQLYCDTVNLEVDLQKEIYEAEKRFDNKYAKIFDQRLKVLEDFKKNPKTGDGEGDTEYGLSKFWLKVLKCSYPEFITKRDEKILTYLVDVRTKFDMQPTVSFTIIFTFEPNEYFNDETLTKKYHIKCKPDDEDPLTYDGAEIYKCEGCKIEWKHPFEVQPESSFFEFFAPPVLPEDPMDQHYTEINAMLENDFELGFYLKERVIPKAILFYTGEIQDCNYSDIESDNEELEVDYEEIDESSDDED